MHMVHIQCLECVRIPRVCVHTHSGVRAAESTKGSFAPWDLFVGMGTSEN